MQRNQVEELFRNPPRQNVPEVVEAHNGDGNAAVEVQDESSLESVEYGLATNIHIDQSAEHVKVAWGKENEESDSEEELRESEDNCVEESTINNRDAAGVMQSETTGQGSWAHEAPSVGVLGEWVQMDTADAHYHVPPENWEDRLNEEDDSIEESIESEEDNDEEEEARQEEALENEESSQSSEDMAETETETDMEMDYQSLKVDALTMSDGEDDAARTYWKQLSILEIKGDP